MQLNRNRFFILLLALGLLLTQQMGILHSLHHLHDEPATTENHACLECLAFAATSTPGPLSSAPLIAPTFAVFEQPFTELTTVFTPTVGIPSPRGPPA